MVEGGWVVAADEKAIWTEGVRQGSHHGVGGGVGVVVGRFAECVEAW